MATRYSPRLQVFDTPSRGMPKVTVPACMTYLNDVDVTANYVRNHFRVQRHATPASRPTLRAFEPLSEIKGNVISKEDLCQLRSTGMNSLFETLATRQIFNSITVRNNKQSADRFGISLHISNPFRLLRACCANDMHFTAPLHMALTQAVPTTEPFYRVYLGRKRSSAREVFLTVENSLESGNILKSLQDVSGLEGKSTEV